MAEKRIVVLDGYTLNPGDNPWTDLQRLGELTVHANTAPDEIHERAKSAEVLVINKVKLTADVLAGLPELKFITVMATGHDCVDSVAARKQGIGVSNVPEYGTDSVAQFALAMLLELAHHVGLHDRAVRVGDWQRSGSFSFWHTPLVELAGQTLGVVGFGRIGRRMGELGHALGMRVVVAARRPVEAPQYKPFEQLPIGELFAQADAVSLHCPLTPETKGLINAKLLATVKPNLLLVNTARGGLVVERDLAEALDARKLAGAAVDVVSAEPIHSDNPLLAAKNCIITPHMAWATLAARRRLMAATVSNVTAYLAGAPVNLVN